MGRVRNEFDSRDISVYPSADKLPPAAQFGVGAAQVDSDILLSDGEKWSMLQKGFNPNIALFGMQLDGHNLDASGAKFIDIAGWIPSQNGSNSPIFEQSSLFTKFNLATIKQGNIAGASTVHGKYKDLQNTYDLSAVDGFTVWAYCDGPLANSGSSVGSSVLMAFGDAAMANSSFLNICGVGGGSWRRGWNNIRFTKADVATTLSGTGVNWASVKRIQIRFTPDSTYTGNPFYIDSLFVGGFAENKKAPVVVTFDDSNEESVLLTRIMNAHGIPTTSFVINEFIDNHSTQPGYQTLEQVKEIYDRGNALCVHGNITNEFVVSPELMQRNRQWLIDKGFVREQGYNYLSYPNGTFNDATIAKAIEYGFQGCRSISGLNRNDASNTHESVSNNDLENITNGGIANRYKINSSRPATAAAALAVVDKAIARQSAAIFYWHTLAELSQAEATTFAAGLKTRIDAGTVEAMTFPSFVKKYTTL